MERLCTEIVIEGTEGSVQLEAQRTAQTPTLFACVQIIWSVIVLLENSSFQRPAPTAGAPRAAGAMGEATWRV